MPNRYDLDNLASKTLRAAQLWGALETFLVPRGRGDGPGPTKVHADVSVDLEVSGIRAKLERAINLAHSMVPNQLPAVLVTADQVPKRAIAVAHNRYQLDTSSFYLLAVRALDGSLREAGEYLNKGADSSWWTATSCRREGCSGTIGIIIRGDDTLAVCSEYVDHVTNLKGAL